MMFFKDRKELADKAEKWMEENHVAKTPLSAISYLEATGWLKPSAQPERKTGAWIEDGYSHFKAVCDQCGEPCATYVMNHPRDRYCKWCGADMRGE